MNPLRQDEYRLHLQYAECESQPMKESALQTLRSMLSEDLCAERNTILLAQALVADAVGRQSQQIQKVLSQP